MKMVLLHLLICISCDCGICLDCSSRIQGKVKGCIIICYCITTVNVLWPIPILELYQWVMETRTHNHICFCIFCYVKLTCILINNVDNII